MYLRAFCIAVILAAVTATSSSAATSTSQHFRFHGSGAYADWFQSTDTGFGFAEIDVTQTRSGKELFVNQDRFTDGVGDVAYTVDTTHGFSFSVDSKGLTTATLSGSNIPARRCRYDVDGNQLGCSRVRINLSAHWTGEGAIGKSTENDHFSSDGFKETFHSNGISRFATATATIAGTSFTVADLDEGELFRSNTTDITICHGTSC
ncbi:MAG: hypothetical protein ACJ738_11955 [Gaiellales bacterium]|jgi:hypothetical protein